MEAVTRRGRACRCQRRRRQMIDSLRDIFNPSDAARKHVSRIWTATRWHLIRCQRRRWCHSLEKTRWFPTGCIVTKRRFSLWTVNDLIWAPDVAGARWERQREEERGREREGETENEEMTGRRETAWQTDSQQQPGHLTELSNAMIVCVCVQSVQPASVHPSGLHHHTQSASPESGLLRLQ